MDEGIASIHVAAVTGILSTAGVIISAWFAHGAKKHSSQTNDAVNHVHGTGAPRLYDLAIKHTEKITHIEDKVSENTEQLTELVDWKRGYDGGPLDDGQKVEDFVERMERMEAAIQAAKCIKRLEENP